MKSYVDYHLLPNETIVYRGHRHWVVFFHPVFWIFVAFIFSMMQGFIGRLVWMILFVAFLALVASLINYFMSEIAVTNMRIIIKIGLIGRSSLETTFQNIATIEVNQSPFGRILNYGTIVVCDTGMMRSPFSMITDPFGFRQAVQSQIDIHFSSPKASR